MKQFRARVGLIQVSVGIFAVLFLWLPVHAQEEKFVVDFGKLTVVARGVDQAPLDVRVDFYEQESGRHIDYFGTGGDGKVSVNLREGVYRIKAKALNSIEQQQIRVEPNKETTVTVDFGRLTFLYNDDVRVDFYDEASDRHIDYFSTGRRGRIAVHLAPGFYKAVIKEPRKEFTSIRVEANKNTVVGEVQNHDPVIESVQAKPALIKAGESTDLVVKAIDVDDDPLTYTYEVNAGSIMGTGAKVKYTAPDHGGTYRIRVTVEDGRGGKATHDKYVSGGILQVTTLGADSEPLDTRVDVYLQNSGKHVDYCGTGGDGKLEVRLIEGDYKIKARATNSIEKDGLP